MEASRGFHDAACYRDPHINTRPTSSLFTRSSFFLVVGFFPPFVVVSHRVPHSHIFKKLTLLSVCSRLPFIIMTGSSCSSSRLLDCLKKKSITVFLRLPPHSLHRFPPSVFSLDLHHGDRFCVSFTTLDLLLSGSVHVHHLRPWELRMLRVAPFNLFISLSADPSVYSFPSVLGQVRLMPMSHESFGTVS